MQTSGNMLKYANTFTSQAFHVLSLLKCHQETTYTSQKIINYEPFESQEISRESHEYIPIFPAVKSPGPV